MKQLDRLSLIDKIARELQNRMTYTDIDVYLKGFKINTAKKTSGANSKWIYVKELLADEPDELIIQLANELELEHSYLLNSDAPVITSGYWNPNQFRLFISHLASFKEKTFQLKRVLEDYYISGFVAHESIEPTQEWQDEIEKALFSMDAMAAILMPGILESAWCDQEIGVAIGRGKLIIPIRRGQDPYGFLGKVQGLQAQGKTIAQVAENVFHILTTNPRTRGRMAEVLVGKIISIRDSSEIIRILRLLSKCEKIPSEQLQVLQAKAPDNSSIVDSIEALQAVNELLKAYGYAEISSSSSVDVDEDIPF